METNGEYEGMSRDDLFSDLAAVESEILGIHARRRELQIEEDVAQDHRDSIVRALGVVVLSDYKYQ